MDITNALLHKELKEEIYVKLSSGLKAKDFKNLVCRLEKSLYNLCQSPKAWYSKLSDKLIKEEFKMCPVDHSLFVKTRE